MGAGTTGNTKVFDSLTGVTLAAEEQGVGTSGGTNGKLVKGKGLTTSLNDAGTGSLGKAESSDGHLGDDGHALIVGDGADNDGDEGLLAGTLVDVLGDGGEGHDGFVGAGHTQTLQDDLVEGRVSATGKEPVELDKKLDVSVLALGSFTSALLDVMLGNVNTLRRLDCSGRGLDKRMDVYCEYG